MKQDFYFRLWHIKTESFIEIKSSFFIINEKDEYVFFDGPYNVSIDDENVEIELWSGLCDKNGKRIYEGDILAHVNECGRIEYHSKVVFENGIFKNAIIERPAFEIMQGLGTGFVVVGNIHENAESLEKEKVLIKTKYRDLYDSKGFPKY